jgi:hypothetical protein
MLSPKLPKIPRAFWATYLLLATTLTAATFITVGGDGWPLMALLAPLAGGRHFAVAAWQIIYVASIGAMVLGCLEAGSPAMRPTTAAGEIATGAFLVMTWCATAWMHRVQDASSWDQVLLFPPAAALVLAVQGQLTAAWLASLYQRWRPTLPKT